MKRLYYGSPLVHTSQVKTLVGCTNHYYMSGEKSESTMYKICTRQAGQLLTSPNPREPVVDKSKHAVSAGTCLQIPCLHLIAGVALLFPSHQRNKKYMRYISPRGAAPSPADVPTSSQEGAVCEGFQALKAGRAREPLALGL